MARPPRIPVLLRVDQEVIYLVTLGIQPREPVLSNEATWRGINETLARLNRWRVVSLVLMPDHLHLLVAPLDRELTVTAFLKWFKRWFNESQTPPWAWQPGGFDHILRSEESVLEKWHYLRENPVRAGLVKHWRDWRVQSGFVDLENDR